MWAAVKSFANKNISNDSMERALKKLIFKRIDALYVGSDGSLDEVQETLVGLIDNNEDRSLLFGEWITQRVLPLEEEKSELDNPTRSV